MCNWYIYILEGHVSKEVPQISCLDRCSFRQSAKSTMPPRMTPARKTTPVSRTRICIIDAEVVDEPLTVQGEYVQFILLMICRSPSSSDTVETSVWAGVNFEDRCAGMTSCPVHHLDHTPVKHKEGRVISLPKTVGIHRDLCLASLSSHQNLSTMSLTQ